MYYPITLIPYFHHIKESLKIGLTNFNFKSKTKWLYSTHNAKMGVPCKLHKRVYNLLAQ